mmetsp:Transcript_3084/g.7734  ORF Transcript_3084/g.7734 Transcript_3084/m.7734 type:complete len:151 (-) Transcript_3084:95-547(-)
MSSSRAARKLAVRGGPLQQKALELLGHKPGPSVAEVKEAIQEHSKKYQGPRQGWQAKAASWVKKMHISRGHVEVGSLKGGRFQIDEALRPVYVVPDLKDFPLKPYVVKYTDNKNSKAIAASSTSSPAPAKPASSSPKTADNPLGITNQSS